MIGLLWFTWAFAWIAVPVYMTEKQKWGTLAFSLIMAWPGKTDWIYFLFVGFSLAFMVWVKYSMGQRWSGGIAPVAGEITDGHFRYLAHPIYFWATVAIGCTAMAGNVAAWFVLPVAVIALRIKATLEERALNNDTRFMRTLQRTD